MKELKTISKRLPQGCSGNSNDEGLWDIRKISPIPMCVRLCVCARAIERRLTSFCTPSLRGIKRTGREADHSSLFSRLIIRGAIPPLPNTSSWLGA
jgi:hypothetical protein